MKFYVDENVNPAVATGLRQRGIDAVATQEVGLKGAADDQQVAFALSEDRVIVTHDADLLKMHRRGVPHAGIAFVTSSRQSLGEIIRSLVLVDQVLPEDALRGRIEYL